MNQISNKIKQIFIGGVFTGEENDRDNGGIECVEYMTFEFRLGITLTMVNLNFFFH